MDRIGGGNETEVYCTDDRKYVVKVKSEGTYASDTSIDAALKQAKTLNRTAQAFAEALGPEHTIPNYYYVARSNQGKVKTVAVQPYVMCSRPLSAVDYSALSPEERRQIAAQLRRLIRRALSHLNQTGRMPDLYGRRSHSQAERRHLNTPLKFPWRVYSFLVKRTLLRSQNLLLTDAPERRLVLVDYDPVQHSRLYRFIYYNVRRLLFLRDYALIHLMERTGHAFPAHPDSDSR
jgi:hypothetical protein